MTSRGGAKAVKYGMVLRFQAWRLGVDPAQLARYSDNTQRARLLKWAGFGFAAVLFVYDGVEKYRTSQMQTRALNGLEVSRRRFYNIDFDIPDNDVTEYCKELDGSGYTTVDPKTGLLIDIHGRMIAPAKHERERLQEQIVISPDMLRKVQQLHRSTRPV